MPAAAGRGRMPEKARIAVSYDVIAKQHESTKSLRLRLVETIRHYFQKEHTNARVLAVLTQAHATNEALMDMYEAAVGTKFLHKESGKDKVAVEVDAVTTLAALTLMLARCYQELSMYGVSLELN